MPTHHRTAARGAPTAPRTKPAPQRRRELLDAGVEVFTARGVTAATIDQITRAAGVAKGTFYLHFETKEHLLAALQRDFEAGLVDRLDQAVAAAGDEPHARLLAWIHATFRHGPGDTAMHDVLFHHSLVTPAPGDPHGDAPEHRTQVASLADVIESGRAGGTFRVHDVTLSALLLCNALHLMFDRIWHLDEEIDQARIHRAVTEMFERTLGCATSSTPTD